MACCKEGEEQLIEILNISKRIGKKQLLDDVSLSIHKGEIFGLLGANGAGKSTLVSILATVKEPSAGTFSIKGWKSDKELKKIRENIGFVPQEIALWEDLTVYDNMRFWSNFTNKAVTKERIKELCMAVRLPDRWDMKVSDLSGGMKRKLNIAVSLLHDPDVLLMDEPTVGIDIQSKLEINAYMRELAGAGKTIIYITHDVSEIMNLCDRIGVLRKGKVIYAGTIEEAAKSRQGREIEQVLYELLKE